MYICQIYVIRVDQHASWTFIVYVNVHSHQHVYGSIYIYGEKGGGEIAREREGETERRRVCVRGREKARQWRDRDRPSIKPTRVCACVGMVHCVNPWRTISFMEMTRMHTQNLPAYRKDLFSVLRFFGPTFAHPIHHSRERKQESGRSMRAKHTTYLLDGFYVMGVHPLSPIPHSPQYHYYTWTLSNMDAKILHRIYRSSWILEKTFYDQNKTWWKTTDDLEPFSESKTWLRICSEYSWKSHISGKEINADLWNHCDTPMSLWHPERARFTVTLRLWCRGAVTTFDSALTAQRDVFKNLFVYPRQTMVRFRLTSRT